VRMKDEVGALRALEHGLIAGPIDGEVRRRLAKIYERSEQWEKLAALTAGDAETAHDDAEKARLYRRAADLYFVKENNPARAADLLEKASALAPADRELLLALCDAYTAAGRSAEAATALEKVVASFAGKRSKELATIHQRLARARLADGDTVRALAELDQAFKIDPGSVAVLRDLGALAIETGDLERAQKTYRALLLQKLDPTSPISKAEVFLRLGEIAGRLGDRPKAVQMLERALENDPSLSTAKTMLAELRT
jgi:tetratricopeptide (TPR) repeat protein